VAEVSFRDVGKVYNDGTRALENFDLEIEDGEFMVFVGPSGCGKTTALRMTAGLEEVTEGEIFLGETMLNAVDPRRRDIAMVFQNYALYPHLTVFENIAFPLRSRGMARKDVRERVERTANLLGLAEMLKRRPRTLSGGQRQRVAMGRALVREPHLFLMDEPLSNLDAKLRVQMRAEISKLQRDLGITTIYVTHDQVEAMTMGTRIAVLRRGKLQQLGAPQELYDHPLNLFVASFIGSPPMNLVRGRVSRGPEGFSCTVGSQDLTADASVTSLEAYVSRDVAIGIRPEHFAEHVDGAAGRIQGEVVLVETTGAERLVHVEVDAEPVITDEILEVARDTDAAVAQTLAEDARTNRLQLVARFGAESTVTTGTSISLSVASRHLHFFDLDTGAAIS
jgi:multiple sugar transport system ATP-binding protein